MNLSKSTPSKPWLFWLIWLILLLCHFNSGSILKAQSILFKAKIGLLPRESIGIFGPEHLIETPAFKNAYVSYVGNRVQKIKSTNPLAFKRLEIKNSYGVYSNSSIQIDSSLHLEAGFISLFAASEVSSPTPYISFKKAAHYSKKDSGYIEGAIAISDKKHFLFPFGNKKEQQPVALSASSEKLRIKMSFITKSNNLSGTAIYSSKNALKRIGIKQLNRESYWSLQSKDSLKIQLSVSMKAVFFNSQEIRDPGLAGWNDTAKNWQVLPLETSGQALISLEEVRSTPLNKERSSALSSVIRSRPFAANKFSRISLCDCAVPNKKYKAYGNFIISPNEDGINEIPVFKGYTSERAGIFRLFNRYGLLVLETNWNEVLSGGTPFTQKKLKEGTYFYTLALKNPKQKEQGFIFIKN